MTVDVHWLPDSSRTPGVVRSLTRAEVCQPGQATRARRTTARMKRRVFLRYGLPGGNHTGWCAQGCEIDHLVALELGGADVVENLWPQPFVGQWTARQKDRLENTLHGLVCRGKMSLETAQQLLRQDWTQAYRHYVDAEQKE